MKVEIARLLKEEGYIRDYHVEKGESFDTLVVDSSSAAIASGSSRPEARVEAGPQGLRAEGSSPARAGGMGVASCPRRLVS
jgi:Ribosomal protein S8